MEEEILMQGNAEGLQQQMPESNSELEVQVPQESLQNSESETKADEKPAKEFTIKQIIRYDEMKSDSEKLLKFNITYNTVLAVISGFYTFNVINAGVNSVEKYGAKAYIIISTIIGASIFAIISAYNIHRTRKNKKLLDAVNDGLTEQQALRAGERLSSLNLTDREYNIISDAISDRNYVKANAILDRLEMEQSPKEIIENERAELVKLKDMVTRFNIAATNGDQNAVNSIAGELMMAGKSIEEEQKGQKL